MFKGFWRAALPALACLVLASCFLQPGKFDSTLDLRKDGVFTFTYKGQIYMLALSKMAEDASKAEAAAPFVRQPCLDDNLDEHPCTKAQLAEQRRKWREEKQQKLQQDQQNRQAMRAMLGGIDPSDPRAAQQLAEHMRRQAGWRSVNYVGDGMFEVDYSITSRLTHDFAFPTLEQFPMNDFFVVITRRQDGSARVEAPGFSPQGGGNPISALMSSMTGGLAAAGTTDDGGKPAATAPQLPEIDGTFRLVTDGQILANNTDEGPRAGPGGQVLQWMVNQRTAAAPMALVKLAP
jgi:hypothetical protein